MKVQNYLLETTKNYLVEISANKGISFDAGIASDYFNKTYLDRFAEIIKETRKDGEAGDIFGALKYGKIDPLTRAAAEVSIKHGCLKYAEEIFNNSKDK